MFLSTNYLFYLLMQIFFLFYTKYIRIEFSLLDKTKNSIHCNNLILESPLKFY